MFNNSIDKIDLVMWTLNSEKTLKRTLKSIENAVPKKYVNQKILVDAHSTDSTQKIAKDFGWKIFEYKKGIGRQANYAVSLVETDIFASFESDIIINPDWLKLKKYLVDNIAVVQGVRYSVNPLLNSFEHTAVRYGSEYSSIDNTLYRTEVIRNLGSFNKSLLYCADAELKERVLNAGYYWLVRYDVISKHLKTSLKQSARALQKHKLKDTYMKSREGTNNFLKFFLSFPIGFYIALNYRLPLAVFAYPYWRSIKLQTMLKKGLK